jgi:hypothetical protein
MSDYIEIPDGLSLAFDDLYDRGWTDGLPVIPPTPELVDEMISRRARSSPRFHQRVDERPSRRSPPTPLWPVAGRNTCPR